MEQNRLRELEDQCIQDCDPPCTSGCPVHVDIRGMTKAVSRENYIAALEIFRKTVPFPGIISRICDQPCQTDCYRKEVGGAIEVALLERACVEYGSGPAGRELLIPRKNQTVAIIGGGLCGMTAALELFKKGYDIQLYEKKRTVRWQDLGAIFRERF